MKYILMTILVLLSALIFGCGPAHVSGKAGNGMAMATARVGVISLDMMILNRNSKKMTAEVLPQFQAMAQEKMAEEFTQALTSNNIKAKKIQVTGSPSEVLLALVEKFTQTPRTGPGGYYHSLNDDSLGDTAVVLDKLQIDYLVIISGAATVSEKSAMSGFANAGATIGLSLALGSVIHVSSPGYSTWYEVTVVSPNGVMYNNHWYYLYKTMTIHQCGDISNPEHRKQMHEEVLSKLLDQFS